MDPKQKLANQLKIQFKLPDERPTDEELGRIIADVDRVAAINERAATQEEWRAITLKHVRFDGDYFYKGLSFQDLNALLAAIREQAKAQSTQSSEATRK